MKLVIDERAYINIDRYNHTVVVLEPKTKNHHLNNGEGIKRTTVGYYRNTPHAIQALIKYRIAAQDTVEDLESYHKLLVMEHEYFEKVVNELKNIQ